MFFHQPMRQLLFKSAQSLSLSISKCHLAIPASFLPSDSLVYTFTAVLTAITRAVSPAIVNCELTFVARQPIDLAKAQQQHRAYEQLLRNAGTRVISLPPEPALPDSMFVEDPAIVLDELAVILPLGTESRRAEGTTLALALAKFRKLAYVQLPGTMEGGDVLRVGRKLFAGLSTRTNAEGIRQLAAILAPHRYDVIGVSVTGCLHLKSAVTYTGRNTLLANRAWFDAAPLSGFDWIDVDPQESHAANALALGDTVILPASFPRTRTRLEAAGFQVTPLDISELQKAESGLTCSSLLFDAPH
jgi:dimethylargininase